MGSIHYEYDSPYGTIVSNWKMESDRIAWKVTVPANATADFAVSDTNATDFRLEGTLLKKVSTLARSVLGGFILPRDLRFHCVIVERSLITSTDPKNLPILGRTN